MGVAKGDTRSLDYSSHHPIAHTRRSMGYSILPITVLDYNHVRDFKRLLIGLEKHLSGSHHYSIRDPFISYTHISL